MRSEHDTGESRGMTTPQLARHLGVPIYTVRRWVKAGCPCDKGTEGRHKGHRFDPQAVVEWWIRKCFPALARHADRDVLKLVERVLYQVLKLDELQDLTLRATETVAAVYRRAHMNVTGTPFDPQDYPDELKRISNIRLDSVHKRRPFHGGDE